MKIIIYTIDDKDSSFCKDLRAYLQSKNLQFDEKRVDTNRDALAEMQKLSDNFAGVPFTVITKDSGEEVKLKGFTQSEFDEVFTPSAQGMPVQSTPTQGTPTQGASAISTDPMSNATQAPASSTGMPAQLNSQSAGKSSAQQNELDKILSDLNTTAPATSVQAAATSSSSSSLPATPTPPAVSSTTPTITQPAQPAQIDQTQKGPASMTPSTPAVPSLSAIPSQPQPPVSQAPVSQPPVSQPPVSQAPASAAMPQMPDFPQK